VLKLDNPSANSKWVAQVILNKMQTTLKVGIIDIRQDMRRNDVVGITKGKAWKAKKITSRII
jgi:predicted RNA-binding protein